MANFFFQLVIILSFQINDSKHQANSANVKACCNRCLNGDLKMASYPKVAGSFFLCSQRAGSHWCKRKISATSPNTIRTPKVVEKAHKSTNKNARSINAIISELKVSRHIIKRTAHEDLRYKSYAIRKGQFMSEEIKDNRLTCAKMKHQVPGILGFFSYEKIV